MVKTGKIWTVEELLGDLAESCGVKGGDILIVHSSMKAIGPVDGGAATVIESLRRAVGSQGTLMMPAFSTPAADGVFVMETAPSKVGVISEVFRTSAGVLRSRHPTHSVCAWGARASELTAGHEQCTPLGVGSPMDKAATAGASVLMIGCGMTSCSMVHVAESSVKVPYLGKVFYKGYDRPLTLTDKSGLRIEFSPIDVPADSQGFDAVGLSLEEAGKLHRCRFGMAECIKFVAMDCLCVAAGMLRRDPASLLCRKAGCPQCQQARRIIDQSSKPG